MSIFALVGLSIPVSIGIIGLIALSLEVYETGKYVYAKAQNCQRWFNS